MSQPPPIEQRWLLDLLCVVLGLLLLTGFVAWIFGGMAP